MFTPQVTQALIQVPGAFAVTALGFMLWRRRLEEERQKAQALQAIEEQGAERQRQKRTCDILGALRAEVTIDIGRLALSFDDKQRDAIRQQLLAQIKGRGDSQMPLIVVEDSHFVFDAIKSELTVLPPTVIGPVIAYYRFARFLTACSRSLAQFETLSDERQTEAVNQYFELGHETYRAAFAAQNAIDEALARLKGNGPDGTDDRNAHLSPPV
jgi:hypothetical protein